MIIPHLYLHACYAILKDMKTDAFLTKLSIVFGVFGLLSWLIASMTNWVLKGVPRLTATDWMLDAGVLLLAAIGLKLGAIYHKQQ